MFQYVSRGCFLLANLCGKNVCLLFNVHRHFRSGFCLIGCNKIQQVCKDAVLMYKDR